MMKVFTKTYGIAIDPLCYEEFRRVCEVANNALAPQGVKLEAFSEFSVHHNCQRAVFNITVPDMETGPVPDDQLKPA